MCCINEIDNNFLLNQSINQLFSNFQAIFIFYEILFFRDRKTTLLPQITQHRHYSPPTPLPLTNLHKHLDHWNKVLKPCMGWCIGGCIVGVLNAPTHAQLSLFVRK